MRKEGVREDTRSRARGGSFGSKARQEFKKCFGRVVGATLWWSDSVKVLSWIRSHMPHTGQFVQRRLKKIRLLSNTESWHYVPSDSYPADIPSRGMRIKELKNSQLWWQGPEFLSAAQGFLRQSFSHTMRKTRYFYWQVITCLICSYNSIMNCEAWIGAVHGYCTQGTVLCYSDTAAGSTCSAIMSILQAL